MTTSGNRTHFLPNQVLNIENNSRLQESVEETFLVSSDGRKGSICNYRDTWGKLVAHYNYKVGAYQ